MPKSGYCSWSLSPRTCALLYPSQNGIHFGNMAVLQLVQLTGIILYFVIFFFPGTSVRVHPPPHMR
jgi:hypothetical protein